MGSCEPGQGLTSAAISGYPFVRGVSHQPPTPRRWNLVRVGISTFAGLRFSRVLARDWIIHSPGETAWPTNRRFCPERVLRAKVPGRVTLTGSRANTSSLRGVIDLRHSTS